MSYNSFAAVYDAFTEDVEYEKRAAYIKKLLAKNGCEGGILLDLACGTGTLSKYLAGYGYDMILADMSPDMLSIAAERLPDALIICQDMRRLRLYSTVNAVVCSLDGINHLTKPDDVKKTFSAVSKHLQKGGVFVFDVNTPYKHENVLGNNTFVYETDDAYLVWQNFYKSKSKAVDMCLDIFFLEGDSYVRECEEFSERAYEIEEICQWLSEAGFSVSGVYDDMKFTKPKNNSQRVYISAVKL
ncbi:MAG: class I SAM-dependent methyltransferase [Clostridia bacterium]|nr:class I SAM-dependent methyltransferase [Clostridia bacterium]